MCESVPFRWGWGHATQDFFWIPGPLRLIVMQSSSIIEIKIFIFFNFCSLHREWQLEQDYL